MIRLKRQFISLYRYNFKYPIEIFLLRFKKKQGNEIVLFHHIPKTAGTTLNVFLKNNFQVFKDYRMGWENKAPKAFNVKNFDNTICISGHFDYPGAQSPEERYGDQMKLYNKRFRKITFLRDPFKLRVSLFNYLEQNNAVDRDTTIEDFLLRDKNFLAQALNCNETNYQEAIDKYFFIGFAENFDESLQKLSELLGTRNYTFESRNISKIKNSIDEALEDQFYLMNRLDYKIYEYAKSRFK